MCARYVGGNAERYCRSGQTPAARAELSIFYIADIGTIFEGPKLLRRPRTAT
jgi:hypothetical protein